MAATPEELFVRLDALGIQCVTHHHPPVHTVEEAKALRGTLEGGHTKNLFLKDKKGALFLVVALEYRQIDLKALSKILGAGRFSFGNADLLYERLGVQPGSVTPFSVINDQEAIVQVVLDKGMMAVSPLNFHPLENDKTTAIAPEGLLSFLADCGHSPQLVDLEQLG